MAAFMHTSGDEGQSVSQVDLVATVTSCCSGAMSEALLTHLVDDCLCPEWESVGKAFSQLNHNAGVIDPTVRLICSQPEFLALAALRLSEAELQSALQSSLTSYWAVLPLTAWDEAIARYQAMWRGLLEGHDGDAQADLSLQGRLSFLGEALPVLAVPMDWMAFRHLGAMPSSIVAVANDQAPARLVSAWRQGEDGLVQRVLFRTHGQSEVWPSSMIGKRALAAFRKRVPDSWAAWMKRALDDSDQGIFWPQPNDHKATVVNLPLLMGIWAASGIAMDWWRRQGRMQQVMTVQAFDPTWFQVAYSQGVKIALAYGLPSISHGECTS